MITEHEHLSGRALLGVKPSSEFRAVAYKSRSGTNPVRKCVLCLYSVGFGLRAVERATGYPSCNSRQWLKRIGAFREGDGKAQQKRGLRLVNARMREARFPGALRAFWPSCRVEKVKAEKARMTTEERNARAAALAKAYYYANRDKLIAYQAGAYKRKMQDPEFRKRRNATLKKWHAANPSKRREYQQRLKNLNPERFREYSKRSMSKPGNRIANNLRNRLRKIVNRKGGTVTSTLTGCNATTLKMHLQSQFKRGMTWGNYGTAWHVDHIVPCAKFDLSIKSQQQACFHFSNLRPLFAQENLAKSDSVVPCQPELLLAL